MQSTIQKLSNQKNGIEVAKQTVLEALKLDDGTVLSLALSVLENLIPEKEFVAFCDEVYEGM